MRIFCIFRTTVLHLVEAGDELNEINLLRKEYSSRYGCRTLPFRHDHILSSETFHAPHSTPKLLAPWIMVVPTTMRILKLFIIITLVSFAINLNSFWFTLLLGDAG